MNKSTPCEYKYINIPTSSCDSAQCDPCDLSTGGYGNVKGSARPASSDGRAEFIVGFSGIPCEQTLELLQRHKDV